MGYVKEDANLLDYDSFCKLKNLTPYDKGAELGSSLELYEEYLQTPSIK